MLTAPAPEPHTWTHEDIQFVIADCLQEIDETGERLAVKVLETCAGVVEEIHTELGHPSGFDPHVYALIYARGKFEVVYASDKVIARLEDQAEQDTNLIGTQQAMIGQMKKLLDTRLAAAGNT